MNDIVALFERIKILMRYKCKPYVMRYKDYEKSPYRGIYITIARWCNQPQFLYKKSFREFCEMRADSNRYMCEFEDCFPVTAGRYFDMKWSDYNN